MEKKKLITVLVLTITLVLTLVAVFTAFKLYQVGKKPEETPVPKPVQKTPTPIESAIPEVFQAEPGVCELTFNLQATPTPTPTSTPTPTPTPTPIPECWDTCTIDSECPSSLRCQEVSGVSRCVNPSCPEETDCVCSTPTPSPTPTPTPTPTPSPTPVIISEATPTPIPQATPAPELPSAGVVSPTIAFGLGGILLILLGLLF